MSRQPGRHRLAGEIFLELGPQCRKQPISVVLPNSASLHVMVLPLPSLALARLLARLLPVTLACVMLLNNLALARLKALLQAVRQCITWPHSVLAHSKLCLTITLLPPHLKLPVASRLRLQPPIHTPTLILTLDSLARRMQRAFTIRWQIYKPASMVRRLGRSLDNLVVLNNLARLLLVLAT